MIAEFIVALPTIVSLLEKDIVSPQTTSPTPISDAIAEFKTETPPITPPITPLVPIVITTEELPTGEWYKPIVFNPWWLETDYKGITPWTE